MKDSNDNSSDIKNNKVKTIVIIAVILFSIMLLIILGILFIPQIKLNGDEYIKIKLQQIYVEKGAVATISGKDVSNKIKISGNVDVKKPGKYRIDYFINNGIVKKKASRIVEVVDDIFPVIELTGTTEKVICPTEEYEEEGYLATDNYDGDITKSVVVKKTNDGIIYTSIDSSNNKTTVIRKITKKDSEKPKISLLGPSTKYVLLNSSYKEQGTVITDNCDKDISKKVKIEGSVNTKSKGTYKITYSVEDSYGNKASIERKVIVYEKSTDVGGVNKTGTIYLTFDDGPSASITPKVLKILKEKNVKATFFVVNKSDKLNYLIKQAYDEGHTVALHSYTHNYKTIYSSSDAYFNDLKKISDKVKNITGEESKIIRFPGGGSNTVSRNYSKGIMTYLTNEVINRGYHYFDWNVSSGDAGGANTKEQVYKNVVNNLKYNRANIVLMHDFENNYKTLNALNDIIDYGLAKGYEFLAIDMTTPLVRHKPNN